MGNRQSTRHRSNNRRESGPNFAADSGPISPQEPCAFMQLPQALRNDIYSHLFSSIRFAHGEKHRGTLSARIVAPAPHGLALLRTCHQVYLEIGKTWLSQVLFCFESPEAMLDKLADLPPETRSMIHYIRVSGEPLMMSSPRGTLYFRTSQALKLLPGLRLDTLTILGYSSNEISYETLDFLVKYSDGWKELHYLSRTSFFLAYQYRLSPWMGNVDEQRYLRMPQPSSWQRDLEDRDGSDAGVSVTIYRATRLHRPGSILHAAERAEFSQRLSPGQDLATYGRTADAHLMASGEYDKEVLVVVRRGKDVDYEEKQGSRVHTYEDIRVDFPGMAWKEMSLSRDDSGRRAVVDVYRHVDDYEWPPLQRD